MNFIVKLKFLVGRGSMNEDSTIQRRRTLPMVLDPAFLRGKKKAPSGAFSFAAAKSLSRQHVDFLSQLVVPSVLHDSVD
jgi:hypothetical protein